jgi:hypothetical protein
VRVAGHACVGRWFSVFVRFGVSVGHRAGPDPGRDPAGGHRRPASITAVQSAGSVLAHPADSQAAALRAALAQQPHGSQVLLGPTPSPAAPNTSCGDVAPPVHQGTPAAN